MSLVKRTYVDGETVITAENLNDIQDAIIENEEAIEDQGEAIEGKYTKPSGGIPSTDLASAVQTSLGKADTALQSFDIDNTLTVSGKAADAKKTGDEISGVRNTLNHKADVIYDTASGDIASFPDGADGMPVKDLTVAIEPVQSGTGDPSPTNVRPISGWTGANVTRTGKNLFDINSITASTNWSATVSENRLTIVHSNNYSTGLPTINLDLVPGTYIVSFSVDQSGLDMSLYNAGTYVKTLQNGSTFNVAAGDQISIKFYNTVAGTWVFTNIQLELGSTATAYEPYSGTLIPISWQSEASTVYGGTLDVTSGVLTVDRKKVTFNGSESWSAQSGVNRFALTSTDLGNNTGVYTDNISNYLDSSAWGDANYTFGLRSNSIIYVSLNREEETGMSVEEFQTYLGTNNLEVCFKLATPVTYQLTPTEVATLLGQNNIWADCGPSTVEYGADTKLYIDKKLAALVAALS